jgi:hypothetical protein
MIAPVVSLVSQQLAASLVATSRPALALLGVQLGLRYVLPHLQQGPAGWAVGWTAIAAVAVLAVLEHVAQREETLARVLRDLHLERAFSLAGTLAVGLLHLAAGSTEALPVPAEVPGTVEAAERAGLSPWAGGLATLGALGASVFLTGMRQKLLEALEGVELDNLWRRLEGGGVLAALVVMIFAPVLALVTLLGFAAGTLALAWGARAWARARDARARRPCPACGYAARVEASCCAGCRAQLPVLRELGRT